MKMITLKKMGLSLEESFLNRMENTQELKALLLYMLQAKISFSFLM